MDRRLILNADDYGRCVEINSAVEELIEANRLRDVSVLVNGQLLNSAIRFLKSNAHVSVGIHWNAVEGFPVSQASTIEVLTDSSGEFVGLGRLLRRWLAHPLAVSRAVELEWRAQVETLLNAKLELSHADSHQHLHAFPQAWRIAVKLCREYGIPALRLPRERSQLPLRRAGAWALCASLSVARLLTDSKGLIHNDQLLGFKRAGAYDLATLLEDMRKSPGGLTEIALHPSTTDRIPYAGLLGNQERQALLAPSLPECLAEMEIELTTWRAIAQ